MKECITVFAFACLMSSPVFAVDLVNKDSQKYEVKIHDVGTTNSSIEGNTNRVSICTDCEIEVVGIGSEKAAGEEKVIIENGSLRKE